MFADGYPEYVRTADYQGKQLQYSYYNIVYEAFKGTY